MATIACPTCARPVPADARFCPACGTAIRTAPVAVEERRVVTVLFADLVGYTSIAERRDPETVKRLVESCFEPLVADIEALGGRVDKLLGDAIVALFGAPVAHEDDADRAVRAGLRMHQTLARHVGEHAALPDIQMRIGINTGEVLVGTLAGSDYTAMGDVVNTASRLQTLAPPGGILVGAATEALCSAAIERQPFGDTQLRGREQTERPWLVTGAAAASVRPLRCDVPFVGRANELALVETAVALVRNGRGGVVSIVGEAGAGKSRLADEIVTRLADSAIVVQTACAPYGETSLWSPVRGALASLLDLDPAATPDDVRAAAERRSRDLWSLDPGDERLEPFLAVVAHLFGHPSEVDGLDLATARARVTEVLTDMVRRHAETRMTVIWVDNLQWADTSVRDLLAVVVRSLVDRPFLLITTQRPDDDVVWPPTELDRPLVLRVPLAPLSAEESTDLVRAMLRAGDNYDAAGNDELVADLVERAGGNPLFLVELAALAECCGTNIELPGSLRALIAARLDQLPAPRRAIVDNAAVLGPNGSTLALERFAAEMGQEFAESDVAELAADGIFDVDGRWWRFRSDIVREVAYQTLTKRTRAQRHAGVAAALVEEKGHLVEEVAHHAATAAELVIELGRVPSVPKSIIDRAIAALRAAAHEAMESGRAEHAIRHATRALDLRHADRTTERDLLLIRASAELDQRRLPAALTDGQRALDSAIEDGDRVHEAEALRRLGTATTLQGDLAVARQHLDAAIARFRELDEPRRLANALRARGFAEVFGGSLPNGRRYLGEATALFEELGDERGEAWIRHHLAWIEFQSGDFASAQSELATSKQHFEKLGDRVGVNWAEGLRAYVTYFQRRFDEAEALALGVISDAKQWGDTWATLMMHTLLANMRLWSGRLQDAEQLAERALAGFREAGDRYGVMSALSPLNRARAGLGKIAEARRGAEEALSLGNSFGELGLAVQGAAGTAMHLGDGQQAMVLAEQVIARHRQMGAADAEALVIRAFALCQVGDVEGAAATIDGIDVDDFPFGRSVRAVVRALNGDADGADADATAVHALVGASYFDLAVARLGGVLAALRSGDAVKRRRWFDELRSLATSVGDSTFVDLTHALSREPATVPDTLGDGWKKIVSLAAA